MSKPKSLRKALSLDVEVLNYLETGTQAAKGHDYSHAIESIVNEHIRREQESPKIPYQKISPK